MPVLTVQGKMGNSIVRIGESFRNLSRYLPPGKTVIITDANVRQAYGRFFPPAEVIEIGTGEGIKNLETVGKIYEALIRSEADRTAFLVGIGGGIVCDVTGFAAATYLRGLPCAFVASTLLAQVDAAVGGKNGVNWEGYKNMIGVFSQPAFVICDPELLRTLPRREILSGMAEVVKHALICDAGLFAFLEENVRGALELRPEVLARLVGDSLAIKSAIVNRDERERGERRLLNFGHTFGHALERATGVSHGEAVGAGMVLAAMISERKGYLAGADRVRMEKLLAALGLPLQIPCPPEKLRAGLRKDKKRAGETVHFVLLQGLGRAVVEEMTLEELEGYLSRNAGG
ncbi:MAG: 3-dehydroquinate synthase [Deltaproteobacteria bacterium]|nr:3-dehydroquinate synthase [Deltaproteobacteria bacterium]